MPASGEGAGIGQEGDGIGGPPGADDAGEFVHPLSPERIAHDRQLIAKVLRQVAGWIIGWEGELLELAGQVEAMVLGEEVVCPLCEEIDCDTGCPLEHLRPLGCGPGRL